MQVPSWSLDDFVEIGMHEAVNLLTSYTTYLYPHYAHTLIIQVDCSRCLGYRQGIIRPFIGGEHPHNFQDTPISPN